MDQNRYFGIEIECVSSVSKSELKRIINAALRREAHTCQETGFAHDASSNTTVWKLKPDASIRTTRSHGTAVEITSPKLAGESGLRILHKICTAIHDYVDVNRSCGLHVHHDIRPDEDVRKVVNAWIDCERFFMQITPRSRRSNQYCQTWERAARRGLHKMPIEQGSISKSQIDRYVSNWWHEHIGSRYSTLNMEGYLYRGAVEFRLHSATYEYDKISNWIVASQHFVNIALAHSTMFHGDSFDQFCDYMLGAHVVEPTFAQMQQARTRDRNAHSRNVHPRRRTTGQATLEAINFGIHPDARKQRLPRENTKLGVIARMLLSGGHTKQDIANKLREQFGAENGTVTYEFQVGCKIADMGTIKYGYGWHVYTRRGKLYVLLDQEVEEFEAETTQHEEVAQTPAPTLEQNALVTQAFVWMRQRREHFASVH